MGSHDRTRPGMTRHIEKKNRLMLNDDKQRQQKLYPFLIVPFYFLATGVQICY